MKIILTKRFVSHYLRDLDRHFSKEDFVAAIKTKQHTFISLRQPYFKIKTHIKTISIRGVLVILEADNIVPLMIFLKKDKKYGENIRWEDYKDAILEEQKRSVIDITNGDYEER